MIGSIGSTKHNLWIAASCAALAITAGCAKKKTPTGTGGGGGAWVVGQHGLMANIPAGGGGLGEGYNLGVDHDLLDITCRGKDTAFVVGELGTFLRTYDAGVSWESVDLGTARTLRSVAAQGSDTIYVAGDQALLMSGDSGTTWRALPIDQSRSWLGVAAGHQGFDAFALDSSGAVWQYDAAHNTSAQVATLALAQAIGASHDGTRAAVAGLGRSLLRSDDGGASWRTIDLGRALDLHDLWITATGEIIAVGAGGVTARVDATDEVTIATAANGTLRALHIDAAGHGFAVGDAGLVLSTEDAGVTWTHLDLGLVGTVFGVDDVDGDGHL